MQDQRAKHAIIALLWIVGCIYLAWNRGESSNMRMMVAGVLATMVGGYLLNVVSNIHSIWFWLQCNVRHRGKLLRFSMSYLVRIKVDNKYVLIMGKRVKRFQPVGGVYKCLHQSITQLEKLGVGADEGIPLDEDTEGDLRIMVPAENAVTFLNWFQSEEGREYGPWREFYQELIETKLLPTTRFRFVMFRKVKQHQTPILWTKHFGCYEIRVADIFEADLTDDQIQAFREALTNYPANLRSFNEGELCTEGVAAENQTANITDSAKWLLDKK